MKFFEQKQGPAYQTLGRLLRQAREEAGLNQVEVARLIGKPQSFISKCESGERRIDVIELKAFARLYGKALSFFDVEIELQCSHLATILYNF